MGAPADRAYDARVAAANRDQHNQHAREAVKNAVAKQARFVYVVTRRKATDAVAALPVATIVGRIITLRDTAYMVPPPIAEYVTELRNVVALQGVALQHADTAIRKTQDAQAIADTIATTSDSLAQEAIAHEKGNRPGFFGRAWGAIRFPVALVGGFALGVLAKKAGL